MSNKKDEKLAEELANNVFNRDGKAEPFIKAVRRNDRRLAKRLLNDSMIMEINGEAITDEELDEIIREFNIV